MKRFLIVVMALAFGVAQAADAPFPHREKFKQVPVLEIDDLLAKLDGIQLVDVRSHYEFSTLHMKGAVNIPLNSDRFVTELKQLRAQGDKPIVFYCNGHTCKKSYEAVEKAQAAGISNCQAYDAGIYSWAKKYPEHSILLGQSPMQAGKFIEDESFKKHVINAGDFEAKMEAGAMVLDIRDLRQRDSMLFPFKEQRVQLDDKQRMKEVVEESKRLKKTLLVYDKVGKQTRWFQYFLEQQGIKEYYFMDGGSEAYFEFKYGKLKYGYKDNS